MHDVVDSQQLGLILLGLIGLARFSLCFSRKCWKAWVSINTSSGPDFYTRNPAARDQLACNIAHTHVVAMRSECRGIDRTRAWQAGEKKWRQKKHILETEKIGSSLPCLARS
jgi:hypothetical protein